MNKENKIHSIYNKLLDKFEDSKKLRIIIYVATLILVIALPKIGLSSYLIRVMTMIALYSLLGQSLNLITGYTGQVSIGHAGFCAIGGYTSALLNVTFGMNFVLSALCAMIIAGVFGFLLGAPTLRLSGTYLTIATLGFGEIVRMIALNWEGLTGGPLGVANITRPVIFGKELTTFNGGLFYLIMFLLLIVSLAIYAIVRSKMGRAFMAIRDDALAATLMGIEVTRYKVISFVISAMIAGLGGSFYVHMVRFIDPNTFNFDISILIVSIIILGGMGSMRGIFLGAILLISFPEILRFASEYRFIVYGLILVVMIRFKPEGLLGGQIRRKYRMPSGVKGGL
ncbi:amino acid/amide ABC transporter membrane protein 2, HAAT family [Dethiosulfatibacter aminovorans DSM 17477]|uniref:Amino acid/amide ABC transporter membrane protein 2, HAAT family n=1 Tax=Dethiosulfatibacter aminovorans DSM 17477 TaxID=1121476 RepID=A0A1M6M0U6_9FIRM|nr:branched-chain amino acid ABC transporter permease [Dethiosulfatibacter aminovorans]SHJ77122.1 amino acid/amide ABC transporter membrane protein 2, HAAT family [Dethiosulfatibacter aminovorans DSM 17477]